MRQEWYEIRVEGQLPAGWSHWFEDLDVHCGPDGNSILAGPVADQAALHGLLAKIRDLNLTLIAVNRRPQEQTDEHS